MREGGERGLLLPLSLCTSSPAKSLPLVLSDLFLALLVLCLSWRRGVSVPLRAWWSSGLLPAQKIRVVFSNSCQVSVNHL